MAQENAPSTSLFDMLSTDLFEHVLRFVSHLPNSVKWESHVDLADLVNLIAVHGELGRFIKARFTTLCISSTKNCANESGWLKWEHLDGPHLWTNSIDVALRYILAGGGKSLDTLVVGIGAELDGREDVVDDFVTHCPNVKALKISESGPIWVKKFRNQIDKLGVRADTLVDMPPYIPKLKELNLDLIDPNLEIRVPIIPPGFWTSIGCNLEKLAVTSSDGAVIQVDEIQEYCRGLKSISLVTAYEDAAATATLLASYGDQLEYAYLDGMNEGQVREVADACPNARFDLAYFRGRFSSAGVDSIGPKLNYIRTVHYPAAVHDDAEWRNLWSKCINIRELNVVLPENTEVKQIFATPKKKLKVLRLGFLSNAGAENAEKVMKICTEGTTCIEKFSYTGLKFYGDGPKKFLEANRDTLKSVNLGFRRYEPSEELDELLDLLLDLPALEELFMDCTIPTGKLETLKKRGIYFKRDIDQTETPGPLYPVPELGCTVAVVLGGI